MRLLIADSDYGFYAEQLAVRAPHLQLFAGDDPAALGAFADASLWLGEPDRFAELLAQGHKPKWLQSTWAGITPLMAPQLPKDYVLTRAVGIFGQVMAEYVLEHILVHQRRHVARLHAHAEKRWDNHLPGSLAGRRVLIVGAGDIGQQVAQFLAPFKLELQAVASSAREQAPFAQVHALTDLAQVIGWADYVVNLLPDTPATENIYNAALLAQMKRSALLINAGRGKAVVDQDLCVALEQGLLAGAVLDVCRQEPLPPEHGFWRAPNLLITGHSAAPTDPALLLELFLQNLSRWQAGQTLRGEVCFERGY